MLDGGLGFGTGTSLGRTGLTQGRIQGSVTQGISYPHPFFDIAHTYLPVTIKQLFRWCRYYFLTNPLINATAFKLSEYPITDLIVEHPDEKVRRRWTEYFQEHLRFRSFQIECGLDFHIYGNSFISLVFPFHKYLKCAGCGFQDRADKIRSSWTFTNLTFRMNCPKCGSTSEAIPQDFYYKDANGIVPLRWNCEHIEVTDNEVTGKRIYFYTIPPATRNDIVIGKKDIVESVPQIFIQALREKKGIVFSKDNFFHMKRPSLAQQDRGWGIPLILPVLKDTFYLQLMKKAQECVAPETLIETNKGFVPAGEITVGTLVKTHLGRYRKVVAKKVKAMIKDRGDYAVKIQLADHQIQSSVFSSTHPLWILQHSDNSSTKSVLLSNNRFDWVNTSEIKTGDCAGYPVSDGNYKINYIESIEVVDCPEVISFEIEEDHSFCVPGMATKNSILLDHIVPLRILFPQPGSGSMDPYSTISLTNWKEQVAAEIARWRTDPNYVAILPIPLGNQTIGGDGRALLLTQEIQAWSEQIVYGLGVPRELIYGGLSYSGSNVSMRMLENQFLGLILRQKQMANWVMRQVAMYMDWPMATIKFKPFKMADDIQRKAYLFQLNQSQKISDTTLLADADLDQFQEDEIMLNETAKRLESSKKQQLAMAEIQAEAQVIMAKAQAKAQQTMLEAQQAPPASGEPGGVVQQIAGSPLNMNQSQGLLPAQGQPPMAGIDINQMAQSLAQQILQLPPDQQDLALANLKAQSPELAQLVQQLIKQMQPEVIPVQGAAQQAATQVNMQPLPEQKPARREATSV
jgi:hypothetical protein